MIAMTPVHKLTAEYQFKCVKEAAGMVESCGGVVLGSMTDNHKINQIFCGLFVKKSLAEAVHPLDANRVWYLLFDSVHLLKCLRNNWISEKEKKLSFDGQTVGSFADVEDVYEAEKESVLKTTTLTSSSVYPTRLQLQNVSHVLRVINDRTVAALRLRGKHQTADFIQQVLTWWKMVNVKTIGESSRFRDPDRSVQEADFTKLQGYLVLFKNAVSGQGANRVCSITHDTKKAMIQTLEGFIGITKYLMNHGFRYVLLGSLQSDRIEGEFSVYRHSTGSNLFMASADVISAFKRRLVKFSGSVLNSIEMSTKSPSLHTCAQTSFDEASLVESAFCIELTTLELYSAA